MPRIPRRSKGNGEDAPPQEPQTADDATDQPTQPLTEGDPPPHAGHAPSAGAATGDEQAGAATGDEQAGAEQAPEDARPGFRQRTRMRRRLRYLRRRRELAFRDLGGLMFDLHRFGRERADLVHAKLDTLSEIDHELRTLEAALRERRDIAELREAGIAGCPRCGTLHGTDANFCPGCGTSLRSAVVRDASPVTVTPADEAAPLAGAGAATPADAAARSAHATAAPPTEQPTMPADPVSAPAEQPTMPADPVSGPAEQPTDMRS